MFRKVIAALLLAAPFSVAHAAITLVNCDKNSNATVTSITLVKPTGTAQNDVVIGFAVRSENTDDGDWVDPADWTLGDVQDETTGSADSQLYWGYKVWGATDGDALTFDFGSGSTATHIGAIVCTFRGVDTSTPIDVTYSDGSHYNTNLNLVNTAAQPITTVTNNAWVLLLHSFSQEVDAVCGGEPSGYTLVEQFFNCTSTLGRRGIIYRKEKATAGVETPGAFNHADTDANADGRNYTIALRPVLPPTFSAGPSAGGVASTTITVNFTSTLTGTVYSVACPNGQANPTVAQVKAGNCTGDIAAVSAVTESVTGGVADSDQFTGLTASTTYDTHYAINNAVSGDSTAIASLADQTTSAGGATAFTNGPTVTPAADGFTVGGTVTCTGTCTVEAVWCNPGDTAPTNTELEAGNCGGGNAAIRNAQENWTTAVGNDFLLTSANKPVRADVYVAGTNGTTDTAVITFADQDRSIRSGFAKVVLTSCATTAICDLDSYYTPDVATGDVYEYEDDVNESANCNILFAPNGNHAYYDATDGVNSQNLFGGVPAGYNETGDAGNDSIEDCAGRLSSEYSVQDESNPTDGQFTAPANGDFVTDDTIYQGNVAPDCPIEPENETVVLIEDVAMSLRDLIFQGSCVDAEGDALTFSVTGGTLPVGTSLGGTGNKDWTGTPTTENEAGTLITITATDIVGDTDTYQFTVYVVNTWTVPNIVGLTVSAAEDAVVAVAPWRENDPDVVVTQETCDAATPGSVLTQNPTATTETGASTTINVTIAADCARTWVSYSYVWMFREVRRIYLTTSAFKGAVETNLRASQSWTRWAPGTLSWSGSSNMEIDVTSIPGVPALYDNGAVKP